MALLRSRYSDNRVPMKSRLRYTGHLAHTSTHMGIEMMKQLAAEASKKHHVPSGAASLYHQKREQIIREVDEIMTRHPNRDRITGRNPIELMKDNHRSHGHFMANVFILNRYDLLVSIVPRVYRTFLHHGFKPSYFPVQIKAWIDAVVTILDKPCIKAIVEVYRWLLGRHDMMVQLAEHDPEDAHSMDLVTLGKFRDAFTDGLLNHGLDKCMQLVLRKLDDMPIDACYRLLIHPSLHQLVQLRERELISMEQELNASSLAGRILAHLYMPAAKEKTAPADGRAIIFQPNPASPDMGSWKLSDLLRSRGWQLKETAIVTESELALETIRHHHPDLVVFSGTMPLRLERVSTIANRLKTDAQTSHLRILLDGPAFFRDPDFAQHSGADAATLDADEACSIIDHWFGQP